MSLEGASKAATARVSGVSAATIDRWLGRASSYAKRIPATFDLTALDLLSQVAARYARARRYRYTTDVPLSNAAFEFTPPG